jgi:hypothetical protein
MQRDGCANGVLLIEKGLEGGIFAFMQVIHFDFVIASLREAIFPVLQGIASDDPSTALGEYSLRSAHTLAMTVERELSCGN